MIDQYGVLFKETQRFRQWWIWALLLIAPGILVWGVVQQLVFGVPWGNNPASDWLLILLACLIGVGVPAFMFWVRLDTVVRYEGVYVRFFPFHLKWVAIPFDLVESVNAVEYSPLREYGGWGIRYGASGKAYNVSGNLGVMLELKDGKRLLIGSRKAEELGLAITSAMRR
jgi:hypothetical protein